MDINRTRVSADLTPPMGSLKPTGTLLSPLGHGTLSAHNDGSEKDQSGAAGGHPNRQRYDRQAVAQQAELLAEGLRPGLVVELTNRTGSDMSAGTSNSTAAGSTISRPPQDGLKYRVMSGRINFTPPAQPPTAGAAAATFAALGTGAAAAGRPRKKDTGSGAMKGKNRIGSTLKSFFSGGSKQKSGGSIGLSSAAVAGPSALAVAGLQAGAGAVGAALGQAPGLALGTTPGVPPGLVAGPQGFGVVGMVGPQAGIVGPQTGMVGPQVGMVGPQAGMVGPQAGMLGPRAYWPSSVTGGANTWQPTRPAAGVTSPQAGAHPPQQPGKQDRRAGMIGPMAMPGTSSMPMAASVQTSSHGSGSAPAPYRSLESPCLAAGQSPSLLLSSRPMGFGPTSSTMPHAAVFPPGRDKQPRWGNPEAWKAGPGANGMPHSSIVPSHHDPLVQSVQPGQTGQLGQPVGQGHHCVQPGHFGQPGQFGQLGQLGQPSHVGHCQRPSHDSTDLSTAPSNSRPSTHSHAHSRANSHHHPHAYDPDALVSSRPPKPSIVPAALSGGISAGLLGGTPAEVPGGKSAGLSGGILAGASGGMQSPPASLAPFDPLSSADLTTSHASIFTTASLPWSPTDTMNTINTDSDITELVPEQSSVIASPSQALSHSPDSLGPRSEVIFVDAVDRENLSMEYLASRMNRWPLQLSEQGSERERESLLAGDHMREREHGRVQGNNNGNGMAGVPMRSTSFDWSSGGLRSEAMVSISIRGERGKAASLLRAVKDAGMNPEAVTNAVAAFLSHVERTLPAPGKRLVRTLQQLCHELEGLMLNQANYRRLFERMLLLLALVCEVLSKRPMAAPLWHKISAELQDVCMAVNAYMGQGHFGRWLAVLQNGEWQPELLASWWSSLAAAGLSLLEELPEHLPFKAEWRNQLNNPGRFEDEGTHIKNAVSSLGGQQHILTQDMYAAKDLISMLNTRKRYKSLSIVQMQQAMRVVEAEKECGPHSVVTYPVLRLFWHRFFSTKRSVTWRNFWEVFPSQLSQVGVDWMEMEGLQEVFAAAQHREAFQQHVAPGLGDKLTPLDLDRAFPCDVPLLESSIYACGQLDLPNDPSPGFCHLGILQGILDHVFHAAVPAALASPASPASPVGPSGSVQLVYGKPGMGKSTVVQEVVKRLRSKQRPLGGMFVASFVEACSRQEMGARLCDAVGAVVEGDDMMSLNVCLQRLSRAGGFLLVMEDVTQAAMTEQGCQAVADIVQQVVSGAPNAHILLTSSHPLQLPQSLIQAAWQLGSCSLKSAQELFKHHDLVLDLATAQAVVEACDYHPLSVSLAAACIAHGHCVAEDIMMARHRHPRQPTHHGTEELIPNLPVVKLVLTHLPEQLQAALTHLAILPHQFSAHTAALVLHKFDRTLPDVEWDEHFARGVLSSLVSRSLLTHHPATATWSLSPTLQSLTTKTLCPHAYPAPALSGFHRSCCELLRVAGTLYKRSHCFLAIKWANKWRRDLQDLLHMVTLRVLSMALLKNVESLVLASPVLSSLGIAPPSTLLSLWNIIQPVFAQRLSPNHPSFIPILLSHGEQQALSGNLKKAEQLYRSAVQLLSTDDRELRPGTNELQLAEASEKLGMVLLEGGNAGEAAMLLRHALNVRQRLMSAMSVEVAETRIHLAAVLDEKGGSSHDAGLLLTEGYNALVKAVPSGEYHLRFLDMFSSLASSYMSESLFKDAALVYHHILSIQKELYEPGDPRMVRTLCKLAVVLREMEREEDAELHIEKALRLQDDYYGRGSPQSLQMRLKLAANFRQRGHKHEAQYLYMQALQLQEQQLGPTHPDLIATLCELGDVAFSMRRRQEAVPFYSQAAQVMESNPSPNPLVTIRVLQRLVASTDPATQPDLLEQCYFRLHDAQCSVFGESSKQVADTKLRLGALLHDQGRSREAAQMTETAVGVLFALEGDTWKLAKALKTLAVQLSGMQQYGAAEEQLRRAVTIEFHLSGEDKTCLTEGLMKLAEVAKLQGKLNDAEEAIDWLIEINKEGPAATNTGGSIGIARLLMNLAAVREQQGKLLEAYGSLEEALLTFEALKAPPAGWRHEDLLVRMGDLAGRIGMHQQAEQHYCRAVSLMHAPNDPTNTRAPPVLCKWAASLSAQSKHSEAVKLCEGALKQQRIGSGEKHPDVVPTLLGLADALQHMGSVERAEGLYYEALEILEFLSSSQHQGLLDRTRTSLSLLLEAQGKAQQLAESPKCCSEASAANTTAAGPPGLLAEAAPQQQGQPS